MDKLEKFIKEKRSSLDDRNPPESIWNKINDQLDSDGKEVFMFRHLWKVAAIFLFAVVVWLLADRHQQQEIRHFIDVYPEADAQLSTDINKLDSSYQELKKKLLEQPNDKIIDAMVINLQTRIEILNQQLNILERIKQLKEQGNETSNI